SPPGRPLLVHAERPRRGPAHEVPPARPRGRAVRGRRPPTSRSAGRAGVRPADPLRTAMAIKRAIVVKRLDRPDEARAFDKGAFCVVRVGASEIGRAEYQPGWRWSVDVAPLAGTPTCQVEHVGLVLSGRAAVRMDDGEERVLVPGDVFYVPPGHDSWVVGDEPYVSLHLAGAGSYAARHERPRPAAPAAARTQARRTGPRRARSPRSGRARTR